MKKTKFVLIGVISCISFMVLFAGMALSAESGGERRPATFCNPLNLDYRFGYQLSWAKPSRREAADPAMIAFKGEYWLFASKSGGYWHSVDMVEWKRVEPHGLPEEAIEAYAPAVTAMGGRIYYTAGGCGLFSTDDPAGGHWRKEADFPENYTDPAMFVDDDGRFFIYDGCVGPIRVTELDPKDKFRQRARLSGIIAADYLHRGWEVNGNNNRGSSFNEKDGTINDGCRPCVEGTWMTKHNGKYYLQYAAPATEQKTYGDGVFVGESPTGPFTYADYSPFCRKPTGFICGAGHSATFNGLTGDSFWHVTTLMISRKWTWERRVGIFPTAFLPDGQLTARTYLGDYPQFAAGIAPNPIQDNSPGWMLLSYNKSVEASSTLKDFPEKNYWEQNWEPANAFDEDIRTWWSAATGNAGEWLKVDLGKVCRLDAVQINFSDQGCTQYGALKADAYRYFLEISTDGHEWKTAVDRTTNQFDHPHEYVQLPKPEMARYARLVNVHTPPSCGLFSVSGLRLFGNGNGTPPAKVTAPTVARDMKDRRQVAVSWNPAPGADFYIIRYGIASDRLFESQQVYKGTQLEWYSLNTDVPYFFTVDAVNDSGVTKGTDTVRSE